MSPRPRGGGGQGGQRVLSESVLKNKICQRQLGKGGWMKGTSLN